MRRIRAAFRTNEPQREAVAFLTMANALACLSRPECPLWLWAGAVLFWPALVLFINLISPIPEPR